jgi:preprotein translocase subunit YajC
METTIVENVVAPATSQGSTYGMVAYIVVIFAVLYFLMIRPNKKRLAEYNKMLESLKVGSKVLFGGGMYGKVKKIGEKTLEVEIAKGVVIEITKQSVANVE